MHLESSGRDYTDKGNFNKDAWQEMLLAPDMK